MSKISQTTTQFAFLSKFVCLILAGFMFANIAAPAPAEAKSIEQCYQSGKSKGLNDGYTDGFNDAYKASYQDSLIGSMDVGAAECAEAYRRGYDAGYRKGYRNGQREGGPAGKEDAQDWKDNLRDKMRECMKTSKRQFQGSDHVQNCHSHPRFHRRCVAIFRHHWRRLPQHRERRAG